MTQGQPEEYSEENVNELVGGIRNALDRGEEINKAKQSFFNAGYNKQEIDEATAVLGIAEPIISNKIPAQPLPIQISVVEESGVKPLPTTQKPIEPILSQKISSPSPASLPSTNIVFPSKKETQKLPVAKFEEPKPLNKALVIVLILLGILFVVIAGFLGVFWDQLFGPF
jgi:hypothetical protein